MEINDTGNNMQHNSDTADTEPVVGSNVNILRNKTFNRELHQLVNRIVSNEEQTDAEEIDKLTDSQLLYNLHKIFYRIKNLENIEEINSSFNPYLLDPGISLEKNLTAYLNETFESMHLSVFDVLAFDINDRCYTSARSGFNVEKKSDIIINLKDRLYKHISESKDGYILTADEIKKDEFLSKKFNDIIDDEKPVSLYFIKLSSFTKELVRELISGQEMAPLAELLSPVIIFKRDTVSIDDKSVISHILKYEISLPVYMLLGNLVPSLELTRFDNFDSLINVIETLLAVSILSENFNGILIKISKNCDKKMLFQIKYMYSRLINSLDRISSVIRIKSDAILVITDISKNGIVNAVTADFNRMHNNILEVEVISTENRDKVSDILTKICF